MDSGMLHYLQIYKGLREETNAEGTVSVTIAKLSELLFCTPRNVKFVLRRLEEKGWIRWTPGRGRGNGSVLAFLRPIGEVLEMKVDELLENGRMSEALDLIADAQVGETLKRKLWMRVNVHLGLRSEPEESSTRDVLQMIRGQRLENVDPAFAHTVFEVYILGQLFDTLVDYDTASERFLPKLAHRWESSADRTRWTFYLRKGIRFHDGRLLTSRDVRSTLHRLRRKNSPAIKLFEDVEDAETFGDYVVVFRLSRPNAFFLHLAGCLYLAVLPADEKEGLPIGSGPFRIGKLETSKLTLNAFDGYFGYRPLIDRVDVWFLPGIAQESRTYHLSDQDDVEDSKELNKPGMGCRYLIFNFRKPGIQHQSEFRKAIRILYDRQAIVNELGGSLIEPAAGFLPSRSKRSSIPPCSLEEAAERLGRSGYEGQTLQIVFMDRKQERLEAQWLKDRASLIGLELELCPQEVSLARTEDDSGELALATEMLEDDWELELLNFFLNTGTYLNRKLDDARLNRLHEMFDGFMGKEKEGRAEVFERAQSLLEKENWLLYGTHINHRGYFNRNLYGLRMDALGFPNLSRLWVKSGRAGGKD
ncbi:ABC transporter substrate-binding protein [Saccharibacillus sp. CPCC 101409]|uniref:ABC transporter substrate-binding protein n=1 Tax=Saccharibacillus sp. CPCC 101409 TaxID=3058041 RepID=UPI0026728A47|nr:ABC transporter substrate-binding protein [Saccharibacillus sp. CPCC 101409]MDO3412189.1 ABC transporter substrate-binding protein [Saccharibacillus sp. CPCC 101409]